MMVSAVIAHNPKRGDETLSRCVASITDDDPTVEIIVETEGNKSESRNAGVAKSKGEIILFFDDDVKLRRGCIRELLDPFSDIQVGVVSGVNIAFPGIPFNEQISAALISSKLTMFRSASRYTPIGSTRESNESETISCAMAIRRDVFLKAGGFPPDIIPCEENWLVNNVQKLGYKIIYTPFAVVYHNRRKIFMPYFREIFNYGKGRGLMIRRGGGGPRMLYRPNKKWLYYIVGFIGHYIFYISGLIWGLIRGGKKK